MVDEPVTVTYERPVERVLFNPARDANPFFHVFESLWMIAGRNDVKPLAYYNSKIAEIASDDGETFNGAYGYRWRHSPVGHLEYEGTSIIDQLKLITNQLKQKPESRRCVLQMWGIENDLLRIDDTKDVCCLAGETKFRSPEGDICISSLAKNFQDRKGYKFPVYSVDTITGDQRLCWMTNVWRVGTKPVLRLRFDDGSSIRLTSDHKVFRKHWLYENGKRTGLGVEECCAGDLNPGDRLLAEMSKTAKYRSLGGGYRTFRRNLFVGTEHRNMVYEHREYVALALGLVSHKDGYSIHHIDGNKQNNCLVNLCQIETGKHLAIGKCGVANPYYKRSKESKTQFQQSGLAAIQELRRQLPNELRKALFTKSACRSVEQQVIVEEYRSSKSNHKITAIEDGGVMPVYDFTVPGRHNAVLDNGVVVHNCNTHAYFALRDGRLDMTVCNRSNDLIWGMLGANAVHFSFLIEYLAACIGVEVGVYNQFTNNLHAYTDRWEPDKWLADYREGESQSDKWYADGNYHHVPLVKNPETFDKECAAFVDSWQGTWTEPFLASVAAPMCRAFDLHKLRRYSEAIAVADSIADDAWRIASHAWIERRQQNWEKRDASTSTD
jgi:thymidylate synthase